MLQIIIMVKGVAFVGERRMDMYYRNDPKEYSLALMNKNEDYHISSRGTLVVEG